MIDNTITGRGQDTGMMRLQRFQLLDEEQKAQVSSILFKYDPSFLMPIDANSIIDAFKKAGLEPGDGVFEAIHRAGFDQAGTKLIIPMIIACKTN